MGIVADWRNNLGIDVASPDGQIRGRMANEEHPTIAFHDNAYRHYHERSLEHQLSRLCTLMWTAYQRGYNEAISRVTGLPAKENRPRPDARRLRFYAARDAIRARGMSAGSYSYVECTGLRSWHVVVKDHTIANLCEDDFIADAMTAYDAMLRDFRSKVTAVRIEHLERD